MFVTKRNQYVAKAVVGTAAMLAMATSLVACDANDAAIIGGTIAIVAGATGSLDDGDTNDHHHRDRDRDRDRWDRDRDHRGGWDRGGGWDRDHRGPGRRWSGEFELKADSPLALSAARSATPANAVAAKYGIPLESAARATKLLQRAAAGDKTALTSMGLSNDAINRVARYKMPADGDLDQIGSKLAMSRTMAREFVQNLMADTKAQMANVNSPAWRACMKTGKWKTDANGGTCKSVDWAGCSPDQGASMCASL